MDATAGHQVDQAVGQRLDEPLPTDGRGREPPQVRSCLIDGEVVCCDEKGRRRIPVASSELNEPKASPYAFDLPELNGTDLRSEPIEVRRHLGKHPAQEPAGSAPGAPEGAVVFQHVCKVGLEGIVSKRLGTRYRSGRSRDWLKSEPGGAGESP